MCLSFDTPPSTTLNIIYQKAPSSCDSEEGAFT